MNIPLFLSVIKCDVGIRALCASLRGKRDQPFPECFIVTHSDGVVLSPTVSQPVLCVSSFLAAYIIGFNAGQASGVYFCQGTTPLRLLSLLYVGYFDIVGLGNFDPRDSRSFVQASIFY